MIMNVSCSIYFHIKFSDFFFTLKNVLAGGMAKTVNSSVPDTVETNMSVIT